MHTYPHTYQNVKTIFQDDTAWVKKVSRVTLPKGLSPPPLQKTKQNTSCKNGQFNLQGERNMDDVFMSRREINMYIKSIFFKN